MPVRLVVLVSAPCRKVAAEEGVTDNRPKPNADTATSAMRLIDVFVDICFLSLVVKKTLSLTAGKENFFAS
jgi:hypothetical protein